MTETSFRDDSSEIVRRIADNLERSHLSLKCLELRMVELPLREHFRSAIGERRTRHALLVRWIAEDDAWGIAECACRPDTHYSAEYLEGALLTIKSQVLPLLEPSLRASQLVRRLSSIRGWEFTRGTVLDSAFDYVRRQGGQAPLEVWRPLGLKRVGVGISLGLYDDTGELVARIQKALEEGYQRIKLKIEPGMPSGQLQAVRTRFPEIQLGLDANGSFDRSAIPELERLQEIQPAMLEQPFAPDRLDLALELKKRAPRLRLCLDESVHSLGGLETARLLGVLDELNLKPGRVGGELSALMVARRCESIDCPSWIGGMFETGIGRTANLRHAARGSNPAVHDLSPSSRYFDQDLLAEPIQMNELGEVEVPTAPPAIREELMERLTTQIVRLRVTA